MTDPQIEVTMSASAATQFAYHSRMAAVFAVGGESAESASEAVLAWAILATSRPDAVDAAGSVAADLVGQQQVGLSEAHQEAAHRKAHALAMELEGHYVSCGQHEIATLYATVADQLSETIDTLLSDA